MFSDDLIEKQGVGAFAEKSYLDYSMYVVLDRALPSVADGLKPVQRRIAYSMYLLKLDWQAKHKKSSRTVGYVLGSFHPHGELACYEAMVLMAQAFSYRYPLIDGQGNWGSVDDPKSFAASRYTEAKLTKYATTLLSEVHLGTVDWKLNFDGTTKEPCHLPAQLPNVLLNGGMGIAVGMTTDIPPHNNTEVGLCCIHLLENPGATEDSIFDIIQGPDYPGGAECNTTKSEIINVYKQGQGSFLLRATYIKEGSQTVVINALPYRVSPSKILEQIAEQMHKKQLPMVVDLRDESDYETPIRIVLSLKSARVDVDSLMGHLFSVTDLEKSDKVSLNVIDLDRSPRVLSLFSILKQWIVFRKGVVTKRTRTRLDKVEARLHVLAGLLLIFDFIDEVISIIRTSDDPKLALLERFKLTESQVESILEIKLRMLAKLAEQALIDERDRLLKEKSGLSDILNEPGVLEKTMVAEIKDCLDKFGEERRTQLITREKSSRFDLTVPAKSAEDVTVVLSKHGWVRSGKGHGFSQESLSFRTGDKLGFFLQGRSDQFLCFFCESGRVLSLKAENLPSMRAQGEPITKYIDNGGSQVSSVWLGKAEDNLLIVTAAGYGFIVNCAECISKNKAGKALVSFMKKDSLLPVLEVTGKRYVALATQEGRLCIVALKDLPVLKKGKGVRLCHILPQSFASGKDACLFSAVFSDEDSLVIQSGRRSFTLKPDLWSGYVIARAKRGKFIPQGFRKVSALEVVEKRKKVAEECDVD
ncbi:MAG: DNA topoisomerase IV subunit A [Pseudomonadota bacterium]|nr:DNA topoisomerase IV subunit A [Pseudomonadota bacterium]